jgi:hypothetical protein
MPQWEYVTIHLNERPRGTNELDLLNDAGEDGWEPVTITANKVAPQPTSRAFSRREFPATFLVRG